MLSRNAALPNGDPRTSTSASHGPARAFQPCPGAPHAPGTSGRCDRTFATRVEGGPCYPRLSSSWEHPLCDSALNLQCSDEGRCVRVGDGTEGSRCLARCNDGLACYAEVGGVNRCQLQRENGAPCTSDTDCLDGTCIGGRCATLRH